MADISKNILDKIKKGNVRPIPKYYFLFKRSILWSLFGLSILLGSIASGIVIFLLIHFEWDMYHHLGHSLIGFILLVFPYLWLIFLLGFSIFTYLFFRRTEHGYRYKTVWIVLLSIIFSILGGGLLYVTELPERLENAFQENLPFYRGLEDHKKNVWMSPDQGLLAGIIVNVNSKESIQLEDLNGTIWNIHIGNAIWRGRLTPSENLEIKIIGHMKDENQFIAEEIRPWKGKKHRGRMRENRKTGDNR
ncbi:MAG: hypothetical protein JRJ27_17330 [Deltaproteobacteria bacterium]|nr:hypothetical protein [Deltaproteobacteria bacterium]